MQPSHTDTLERIARVLAGLDISRNGHGAEASAGELVDAAWRDYLSDATAVLNALREPDCRMIEVGDAETWNRMVRAALGEDLPTLKRERRSWMEAGETYQKALG